MKVVEFERGFRGLINENTSGKILWESSIINEKYIDAMENPGSSHLWMGDHHLDREEVRKIKELLEFWLENKRLPLGKKESGE